MKEEQQQNIPPQPDRSKLILGLLVGLLVLAVIFTLVVVYINKSDGGAVSDEASRNSTLVPWAALIPVWIAIFSKKRREAPTEKKKQIYGILIGVTVLLVLLTVGIMFLT